jgi:hypothetical protein
MKIGHSRQKTGTWSASGTGAAILTDAGLLVDGRPDTLTRFRWISGTQTLTSVTRIRLDWATGFVPGLIGLSNLSLPAGTLISTRYRRSTDGAGTYTYNPTVYNGGQRIVEGPRGERTWWLLLAAGADPIVGIEFQFWNNVNGVVSIAASSTFDVGEAIICPTSDLVIEAGWTLETIDPTTADFSRSRQPYLDPGCPYRQLQFTPAMRRQADVYGGSNDLEQLLAKMDRGQVCAYVPRWQDGAGAFDAQMLHRTAMIGVATKLPRISQRAGTWFVAGGATIVESPIPT